MTKQVVFSPQERLLKGLNTLADAVGSTLGPMGQNVIIETPYGATTVTKDGVTVASQINLDDPIENMAAQIVKQAAARTASTAGDGTTTSTVIAQSLVNEAQKLVVSGIPPISIKRGFESLLLDTIAKVKEHSYDVSDERIYEIATVSANNDPAIGSLIARAYEYTGPEGAITIDESSTGTTYVDLSEGVFIDRGFASPYFTTNARKQECVLENVNILITDKKIRSAMELVPILDRAQSKPVLIIADDFDPQVLQLLIINKLQRGLRVAAVRAPSFGNNRLSTLEDLCAITSANLATEASGNRLEDTKLSDLGFAAKVVITKDRTVFIDPKRDEQRISERADHIRAHLETSEDSYSTRTLQKRLASLTSKVAVLRVGAPTETELKEKKDRVDDALRATRAAVKEGYVVGGGTLLARISNDLLKANPNDPITKVFCRALQAPLRRISENASISGDITLSIILSHEDFNYGYNAYSYEFQDLVKNGIIDPAMVVRQALLNAVSAANMILLSSTAVYNTDRTPPYDPGSLDDYATSE